MVAAAFLEWPLREQQLQQGRWGLGCVFYGAQQGPGTGDHRGSPTPYWAGRATARVPVHNCSHTVMALDLGIPCSWGPGSTQLPQAWKCLLLLSGLYSQWLPQGGAKLWPSPSAVATWPGVCMLGVAPQSLLTTILLYNHLLQISHMSEIMHSLSSYAWLMLFNRKSSRIIHVVANGRISFFFRLNNTPYCIYATCSLFIHPLMDT